LFDPYKTDTKPIIHSHTTVQYNGIFFCCVDMIVSAAVVGYRFVPASEPEPSRSPTPNIEARTMSGIGCGTTGLFSWLGKRVLGIGKATPAAKDKYRPPSRACKYLADQELEVLPNRSKRSINRAESDFDDIVRCQINYLVNMGCTDFQKLPFNSHRLLSGQGISN
jgi:hypothetical protein